MYVVCMNHVLIHYHLAHPIELHCCSSRHWTRVRQQKNLAKLHRNFFFFLFLRISCPTFHFPMRCWLKPRLEYRKNRSILKLQQIFIGKSCTQHCDQPGVPWSPHRSNLNCHNLFISCLLGLWAEGESLQLWTNRPLLYQPKCHKKEPVQKRHHQHGRKEKLVHKSKEKLSWFFSVLDTAVHRLCI